MVQNSYVIIFVKDYYDTAYRPLKGTETDDYAIGHTDSIGRFYVRATTRRLSDSLCLGLFKNEVPLWFTSPVKVDDMAAIEIRDYVRDYDGDSEFLGFTCNTDYDYNIVGYEHRMEYDVPEPVEEDSLAQSAIQVWINQ